MKNYCYKSFNSTDAPQNMKRLRLTDILTVSRIRAKANN